MRDSWASPLLRDAFWYAVVALSVNEGAYVATILRGAIAGVPAGEIEAGFAYGMTRAGVLRRIVGPRAWRLALPALTGEAILLLKSTVLASTVTVFDVMGTANTLRFETLRVYEPLAGAAIVYVVLVALLTIPAARLEKHLNRYLTRGRRSPAARRRAHRPARGRHQLIPAFALNTTMSDPRPLLFSFTNRPASAAAVRRAWDPSADERLRANTLAFWSNLARTAEQADLDMLFFADVLGLYDVHGGSSDAAVRWAVEAPANDPMMLIPALVAQTERLAFGVTASTTYEHPFALARRFSTLDHLSNGRIGWNIVTSYLTSAARNFGSTG